MLRDGTSAVVRTVRPEDKQLLREGFERLSPESRYRRFLSAKQRLTEAELRYLTEVDGTTHVAIGALRRDPAGDLPDGRERYEGLGIGRFICLDDAPDVAEAAIAVVDTAQGNGLGSLLLRRLVEAAVERGVRRFRCVVLASNDPMRRLLEGLDLEVNESHDGDLLLVDVPLPESVAIEDDSAQPDEAHQSRSRAFDSLRRLLRLAAEGLFAIRGRVAAFGLGAGREALDSGTVGDSQDETKRSQREG